MLIRVRRTYIPELVIRLHNVLVVSANKIPRYVPYSPSFINSHSILLLLTTFKRNRNLKHVFELANIVADSRYALHEDFVSDGPGRLEGYLRAVRQAVLVGLEAGGADPFRPLRIA